MFILITLSFLKYNVVSSKEDTDVTDIDEDETAPEKPAVSSSAFICPKGPSGRSTYLKFTS